MNTRKISIVISVVFSIVIFSSLSANAAWYTCKVDSVGATSANACVRLTDTDATPDFSRNWFFLAGNNVNQMLATVLTAASMGANVLVNCEGTEPFDNILGIYVSP